jgi:hypothetical protein
MSLVNLFKRAILLRDWNRRYFVQVDWKVCAIARR